MFYLIDGIAGPAGFRIFLFARARIITSGKTFVRGLIASF